MSFTVFSYNATVLLIKPNPTHHMCCEIRPNPTHGWTQPMSISESYRTSKQPAVDIDAATSWQPCGTRPDQPWTVYEAVFTAARRAELTCTKLTQLYDALLVTRVSVRKLIGCRTAMRELQFTHRRV